MLSRVLLAAGALCTSGFVCADVLVGAQLGSQSLEIRRTNGLGDVDKDTSESETALGLIVGVGQPGGGNRVLLEWRGFDVEDEAEVDFLSVTYSHYFPSLTASTQSALRPFIGGSLGYGWLDVSAMPGYNSGDDSNFLYGVRTGLNLAIGHRAEVEVGVRYTVTDLDATLGSRLPSVSAGHYEITNSSAWWIGFVIGI